MRVAMLVVLLADREMESLGTNSIRRLADLGVTRLAVFRDGFGVAIALEGWAYDPAGSAETTLDVVAADAKEVRSPGLLDSHRAGTKASARQGLPEPPTIFKGATRITAPVGGTSARLASWVRPYFPAPSM